MEYKITNESKAKAMLVFESVFGKHGNASFAFTSAIDVLCVPEEVNQIPPKKPFGLGTRLRTARGAELRIVANRGSYAAVNLDMNCVLTKFNWQSLIELQKALEESNATIIEED